MAVTVAAIEAFRKYLTNSFAQVLQFLRSIPPVIPQILKSSLKCPNFLFIDQLDCSRTRYSILIGQLTVNVLRNFFKILRN